MISKEEIDIIISKTDIVEIISSYIKLTRQGNDYVGLCPFHNDKNNPGLHVSKSRNMFKCFTCKEGGSVFSFVQKYEGISFVEAVHVVAQKIGYKLQSGNIPVTNNKHTKLYETMSTVNEFYINNLYTKEGLKAIEYLEKRGITNEIIKQFDIGLSLDSNNSLYEFFKEKAQEVELLNTLGLINRNGIDVKDSFISRIMIPIKNTEDKIVGYTARVYKTNSDAKYKNTRGTDIFIKSDILFNYNNAKKHIRDIGSVIITEGNMDAIKLVAQGFNNTVALMGPYLSNKHIELLKKLNTNIILMLDSDEAGLMGTIKNGEELLSKGIICSVIRLTGAKDPDEYIEKFGKEALENNLASPLSYIDFRLKDLKQNKDLTQINDKTIYVKEVKKILEKLDDVTKQIIITSVSTELNVDKSIFDDLLPVSASVNYQDYHQQVVNYEPPPPNKDKYKILTYKIFYYLASDNKYFTIYKKELNFFKEKIERDLASEIETYYKENTENNISKLSINIMYKPQIHSLLEEAIKENSDEELVEENFVEYIKMLKTKIKEDEIKILKNNIRNEIDIDKKIKLIEKLTIIKKG